MYVNMEVLLGNIKNGIFFVKWLVFMVIFVLEFFILIIRIRLFLNMFGCLYCWLWKYFFLKVSIFVEKIKLYREFIKLVGGV